MDDRADDLSPALGGTRAGAPRPDPQAPMLGGPDAPGRTPLFPARGKEGLKDLAMYMARPGGGAWRSPLGGEALDAYVDGLLEGGPPEA